MRLRDPVLAAGEIYLRFLALIALPAGGYGLVRGARVLDPGDRPLFIVFVISLTLLVSLLLVFLARVARGIREVLFLMVLALLGGSGAAAPQQKPRPSPVLPADPLVESLFEAKSRRVSDRLHGLIQTSLQHLDRESPDLRFEARVTLAALSLASRPMVEEVAQGLNRVRAAEALLVLADMGGGGEPEGVVASLLRGSDAEDVRATAALVLGSLGEKRSAKVISSVLSEKKHNLARVASALALARLGAITEKDAVCATLQKGPPEQLHAACLLALGRMGAPGDSKRFLLDGLGHGDATIRRAAILGLATASGADVRPILHALQKDVDTGVRRAAAASLHGFVETPEVRALLLETLLKDRSPEVQASALQAVFDPADPEALDLLSRALRHPEAAVRAAAAALASSPGVDARSLLVRATRDEDPNVRGTAALALAARGEASDINVLLPLLGKDSPDACRFDASLAVALLDPRARETLLRATRDLTARLTGEESRILRLVEAGEPGRALLERLHDDRLHSRGPDGPSARGGVLLELALELLELDRLEERTFGRGETLITRSAAPHLLDLRRWLVDRPYFYRMSP